MVKYFCDDCKDEMEKDENRPGPKFQGDFPIHDAVMNVDIFDGKGRIILCRKCVLKKMLYVLEKNEVENHGKN